MNLFLLAQRIKALRQERGWTLRQLAARTELTDSVLSKVENFRVTPSLPALARIAEALGVKLSELVEGLDNRPRLVVVRADERLGVQRDRPGSRLVYEALAHKRAAKIMEPFLVTIPPGQARRELLAHEGEEFLMVLEGGVRYEAGEDVHELRAGDCLYADGAVKHRVISRGKKAAKLLIVFAGRT
ncbi:MAG: cupin domain-containing protein [Phycisphaerae bacterium]|nr:cupin domain-containing protein [Phycisphaerae bacterium]